MENKIVKYLKGKVNEVLDAISLRRLEMTSKKNVKILRYGINKKYITRKYINHSGDNSDLEEIVVKGVLKDVYLRGEEISKEKSDILEEGIKNNYLTREEVEYLKENSYQDLLGISSKSNLPFSLYLP